MGIGLNTACFFITKGMVEDPSKKDALVEKFGQENFERLQDMFGIEDTDSSVEGQDRKEEPGA